MANAWEPHHLQRAAALPPDSHAKGIYSPLILFGASTLGSPDTQLANDLACGMPVAGGVPPPVHTLSSRKRKAPFPMCTFADGIPARNASNFNRVKKDR